jgi:hypothetical protein
MTTSGFGGGEIYQPKIGRSRDTTYGQKDMISKIFEEGYFIVNQCSEVFYFLYFHNPNFSSSKIRLVALKALFILSTSPQSLSDLISSNVGILRVIFPLQ